jgi:hypothetical protein
MLARVLCLIVATWALLAASCGAAADKQKPAAARVASPSSVVATAATNGAPCSTVASEPPNNAGAATVTATHQYLVYAMNGDAVTLEGGRGARMKTIVTYDRASGRAVASFTLGNADAAPGDVVLAGNRLIVNLERGVMAYDLDGSRPCELWSGPTNGHILSIAASPDGAKLALTEEDAGRCGDGQPQGCDYASMTVVDILDASTGRLLREVPQSDPQFQGYFGQAAIITWRDDSAAVAVRSYTYSEQPGDLATITLDGAVAVDHFPGEAGPYVAPNGRYASTMTGVLCSMDRPFENHDLAIRDLWTGRIAAALRDANISFVPVRWSPDGTELLYQSYAMIPDPAGSPCKEWDASSIRWGVLRADGSPPAPEPDPVGAMRRWSGQDYVEYRCMGKPVMTPECPEDGGLVDVALDGRQIATRVAGFRLVGFLDSAP